jgi:hypothetical protein
MDSQNRIVPFVIVIVIALFLQLAFMAADCRQTPLRVAKQFTEDFFYLDADMQNYLCESLAADGEWVDQYQLSASHVHRVESEDRPSG